MEREYARCAAAARIKQNSCRDARPGQGGEADSNGETKEESEKELECEPRDRAEPEVRLFPGSLRVTKWRVRARVSVESFKSNSSRAFRSWRWSWRLPVSRDGFLGRMILPAKTLCHLELRFVGGNLGFQRVFARPGRVGRVASPGRLFGRESSITWSLRVHIPRLCFFSAAATSRNSALRLLKVGSRDFPQGESLAISSRICASESAAIFPARSSP